MSQKVTIKSKKRQPQPVALSSLKPGDGKAFHFAEISFEDARSKDAFYQVIIDPAAKDGQVGIISVDRQSVLRRDGDRLVYAYDTEVVILRP